MEYKHVQVKVRQSMTCYLFDLDLDPITWILKPNLDIVKMYLHTKKFLAIAVQKVYPEQIDIHTDKPRWNYYLPAKYVKTDNACACGFGTVDMRPKQRLRLINNMKIDRINGCQSGNNWID